MSVDLSKLSSKLAHATLVHINLKRDKMFSIHTNPVAF